MTARGWVFGLWAAAAASAVYWGLRHFVPSEPVPAQTTVVATSMPLRGDLTRLFGVDAVEAEEAPPPESSRFQLVGVVAPRSPAAAGEGVALIAVDGKPARAYRVGAAIDGETVLKAVRARGAALGPRNGEAVVQLDIPPPPAAATGTLPALGSPGQPVLPNLGAINRPQPGVVLPNRPLPGGIGAPNRPMPGLVPPIVRQPGSAETPPDGGELSNE